jgi:hypothetical protein
MIPSAPRHPDYFTVVAGDHAWEAMCEIAEMARRMLPTRQAQRALTSFGAADLMSKPDMADLISPAAMADLHWVALGGDPLDPNDPHLGGRPSTRSTQADVADLLHAVFSGGRP